MIFRVVNQFFSHTHGAQCAYQYAENCCGNRYFKYARANLSPVLYEGLQPGGQLTTTTDIENFPGYPEGISGTQMMEDLRKQAERFGADLRFGVATAADLSKSPYKITIDEEKVNRRVPFRRNCSRQR